MSAARFVVGIDLGTTNSAVAFAEPKRGLEIKDFAIVQLVAEGETTPRRTLPSAIYLAGEHLSYLTGWMAGALESAQRVVGTIHARARAGRGN